MGQRPRLGLGAGAQPDCGSFAALPVVEAKVERLERYPAGAGQLRCPPLEQERVADPAANPVSSRLPKGALRAEPIAFVIMVALLIVAPMVVYPMTLMKCLCFALFACAFNLLIGYVGLLSFGHALYFGLGAYTTALLFTKFGVLPWFGMLGGGLISAAVAMALGYPCFRLRGHYFVIATIVIAATVLLGFTASMAQAHSHHWRHHHHFARHHNHHYR